VTELSTDAGAGSGLRFFSLFSEVPGNYLRGERGNRLMEVPSWSEKRKRQQRRAQERAVRPAGEYRADKHNPYRIDAGCGRTSRYEKCAEGAPPEPAIAAAAVGTEAVLFWPRFRSAAWRFADRSPQKLSIDGLLKNSRGVGEFGELKRVRACRMVSLCCRVFCSRTQTLVQSDEGIGQLGVLADNGKRLTCKVDGVCNF